MSDSGDAGVVASSEAAAPEPAPGNELENAQQQQQGSRLWSTLRGLAMRAIFIYMITSFFRGRSTPAAVDNAAPGAVGVGGVGGGGVMSSAGNLYPNGTIMDLYLFVSENERRPNFEDPKQLIWLQKDMSYGDWNAMYETDATIQLSSRVQNNGTLWLHVYIVRSDESPNPDSKDPPFNPIYTIHRVKQLNRYKKRNYKKTHNLLTGESTITPEEQAKIEQNIKQEILSHWHPNLTINIIDDHTPWIRGQVPAPLQEYVEFEPTTGKYYPIVYLNDYWNLMRDYMPINDTVSEIVIRFTFHPMSLFKWQLYTAQAMRSKWSNLMGGDMMEQDDDDQDVLKETFLETNPILLGLTVVVSITHSIFEILAFKNEIQFWKNRRSLEGLSVRSVFFNVFQSLIVLLYVWDNDTNMMIRISIFVGLFIELWKIKKVVDIDVNYENKFLGIFPRVRFSDKGSYVQSSTRQYDNLAFKYLSWALFPLFIGYVIYSLLYNEHKGWYSFVLNMIYGFLLTFGFIMMTPQLFINYKLKSVAHLPWRMLTYKFLNTFIDDIFAFVIKMPTLYRLGCFRDDIVFLIFLYQRWIYRVDHSRVNEFGISGEDIAEAEASKLLKKQGTVDGTTTNQPITDSGDVNANDQQPTPVVAEQEEESKKTK